MRKTGNIDSPEREGISRSTQLKVTDAKKLKELKEEKRKQKLEASLAEAKGIPELASIFRVKEKLFAAQKDREQTTESIRQIKQEFHDAKDQVKSFIKEQIINFHKSTYSRVSTKGSTPGTTGNKDSYDDHNDDPYDDDDVDELSLKSNDNNELIEKFSSFASR